jgi:tetratricopeptide (TPR) repeat protein
MKKNRSIIIEETFSLAVKNHQEGKTDIAQKLYDRILKINPNYAHALSNLGALYQGLGENQKAIGFYKKTIAINPNYVPAHSNLGLIYQGLGENQKAKECFEKAIKLKPDHPSAHKNLGILLKQKRLLSKIEQAKKSEIKTTISFLKKNQKKPHKSDLRLTSNPFISNRKVEAELISQLYKVNTRKLNDVNPNIVPCYGNGRNSDYHLFENNFSTIKTVAKDLINIMKEAVKSDIFIMESFFNIFQTGGGIVSHNHLHNFDNVYGLLNQKFSLSYYLDIGDQNCSKPGILKLEDPDKEILPTEGMIVIFPASRKHSATYGGKKDRVMIGVNFYSLI